MEKINEALRRIGSASSSVASMTLWPLARSWAATSSRIVASFVRWRPGEHMGSR
jgi:hypothetical protein